MKLAGSTKRLHEVAKDIKGGSWILGLEFWTGAYALVFSLGLMITPDLFETIRVYNKFSGQEIAWGSVALFMGLFQFYQTAFGEQNVRAATALFSGILWLKVMMVFASSGTASLAPMFCFLNGVFSNLTIFASLLYQSIKSTEEKGR